MEKTSNYQLNKPEAGDPLRLADFNQNADIIDGVLKNLSAERVVVGSYTGDGTAERIIDLPFTPKVMLLFTSFGNNTVYDQLYVLTNEFRFTISNSFTGFSTLSACGFMENGLKVGGTETNYKGKVNHYIAIR